MILYQQPAARAFSILANPMSKAAMLIAKLSIRAGRFRQKPPTILTCSLKGMFYHIYNLKRNLNGNNGFFIIMYS
jgi:hypothetical protein